MMTGNKGRIPVRVLATGRPWRRRGWPTYGAGAILGIAVGAFLSSVGAVSAAAQQPVVIGGSGQPDVFVNMQVLNSLGPGPAYPAAAPYGAYGYTTPAAPYGAPYGAYGYAAPAAPNGGYAPQFMTRPGTLLYPPPTPPHSHLTVEMPGQMQGAGLPSQARAFDQPALHLKPPKRAEPKAAEPAPVPQVAEQAPAPAPPAETEMPMAEAETPAAAPEPELPMIPPPSLQTAEAPQPEQPPAPPPAAEEAVPQAGTAETGTAETGTAEPEPKQATMSAELAPPPPPEAPAEPQPETTASGLPEAPQTAALTPGPEEGLVRLDFAEDSADLSEAAKDSLRELAKSLLEDGNARVQLLAYASSADNSASRARRLSLSRALAVRAYLIDQGVRSTRMDVRALGSKTEGGPADRVDILPAQR